MSRQISLTRGCQAIVDEADYAALAEYRWQVMMDGKRLYAVRRLQGNRLSNHKIRMHRQILGAHPGQQIDHINGNGLDNRRANLRLANGTQNNANAAIARNNSSGFKGVTFWNGRKWRARIEIEGQEIFLGYFKDPRPAAEAYDRAAIVYFGEFARTNVSMGLL